MDAWTNILLLHVDHERTTVQISNTEEMHVLGTVELLWGLGCTRALR